MDNPRIEALDAKKTALVAIDLQNFIVNMKPHAPYTADVFPQMGKTRKTDEILLV